MVFIMSIGWRRWLPEAGEGTEMEAIFQRAEVSSGTAANGIDESN